MPAPTAPEVTRTISLPALRCSAICATNCSICARSGCLRLSVRTPVPSLTTMRAAELSNSRCMSQGKIPSSGSKFQFKFKGDIALSATWNLELEMLHPALAIRPAPLHADSELSSPEPRDGCVGMSTLPENELDLEKLFLPAWAQQPSTAKLYAQYRGRRRTARTPRRSPRPPAGPPPGGPPGPRPPGERRDRGPQGDRRGPPARDSGGKIFWRRTASLRSPRTREHREPPPLPEINVSLVPDEKGVESLARQIRTTGRAYPLFDIARLILERPERHSVTFSVKKNRRGQAGPAAVRLRARRYALAFRRRRRRARSAKSFRHVLPGRTHGDRTAEGQIHLRRAMRHERRDSRPAELSRLPEPVAQAAHRALQPRCRSRCSSPACASCATKRS